MNNFITLDVQQGIVRTCHIVGGVIVGYLTLKAMQKIVGPIEVTSK